MQRERTKDISTELAEIARQNGGVLLPQKVVDFAKDETTALHRQFTWDDSDAAKQWRLTQARTVIRMCVTVVDNFAEPVRAFVSLSTDRDQGGYRRIVDILSSEDLSARLVSDALEELEAIKRKYENLSKLKSIWEAVADVRRAA